MEKIIKAITFLFGILFFVLFIIVLSLIFPILIILSLFKEDYK